MNARKLWSLLFLAVPVFGVWSFWIAPGLEWWLPRRNVSSFGGQIDHLFYVILWITGITFVVTEGLLAWFLFTYAGDETPRKAHYIHGHHRTEVVWTLVPAAILVFIAMYQMSAWREIKFKSKFPPGSPAARVVAGQFEWRVFYPGDDGTLGTLDDLVSVNLFHVPVGVPVVFELQSRDVLHSFFLPELRLKQDAVPGMTIPVWFQADQTGKFDLPCAELCGWGHYKMKGRLVVESEGDFRKFLADLKAEQGAVE